MPRLSARSARDPNLRTMSSWTDISPYCHHNQTIHGYSHLVKTLKTPKLLLSNAQNVEADPVCVTTRTYHHKNAPWIISNVSKRKANPESRRIVHGREVWDWRETAQEISQRFIRWQRPIALDGLQLAQNPSEISGPEVRCHAVSVSSCRNFLLTKRMAYIEYEPLPVYLYIKVEENFIEEELATFAAHVRSGKTLLVMPVLAS